MKKRTKEQARKDFVNIYGPRSYKVVSKIARGWSTQKIQEHTGVSKTSIATFRANVSRGAYLPYVDSIVNVDGKRSYHGDVV